MKLAFWGIHNKNGVSSNITAISIMGVLESKYNVILAENHYSADNLGGRLIFSVCRDMVRETTNYGPNYGSMLDENMVEIINNRLFYIQPFTPIKDYYEFNFLHYIFPKISDRGCKDGLVMIDTENNNNISSLDILNASDLVIINLCQSIIRAEIFMDKYSSIINKAVFIVGQYRKCKVNLVKKILLSHGVSLDRIAVIPYSDEFDEAMLEGRSVEFINRNYKCKKNSQNYYFISQLKNATKMILNQVDIIKNQASG